VSEAVIHVGGLTKVYGEQTVLHGVALTVRRGELLGLVGPNGAGKSTLLRTLIGLVRRSGGDAAVLGHDPATHSLAIRRRACYLPGETGVYVQMTGRQFLRFALSFYPRLQDGLQRRLLEQFELPLDKRVRGYSAGMKQKLALVATLVPDVELYLLDEPDRALDASVRFFVRDVLQELKQAGKTIVLSSHHLSEIETLADRLEFLLDGVFVAPDRLDRARAQLRLRPRVRLCQGATLPAGATIVQHEPGGTLLIDTRGDPMAWLRSVPAGAIDSAEVGIPRLEDLYQLLLQNDQPGGGDA
jgi:ABC-2 type transport system ATP-binding protein